MIDLLAGNPLLLLFTVIGLGYLVGSVKIAGFKLGVVAVLFVGIAVGALDPRLALPEHIYILGLVLFVYAVGLHSGPGFFASFNKRGLRINLATVAHPRRRRRPDRAPRPSLRVLRGHGGRTVLRLLHEHPGARGDGRDRQGAVGRASRPRPRPRTPRRPSWPTAWPIPSASWASSSGSSCSRRSSRPTSGRKGPKATRGKRPEPSSAGPIRLPTRPSSGRPSSKPWPWSPSAPFP